MSKVAWIAGANSPTGDGKRWWVDSMIGNFDNNAAPHVCLLGPGP